MMLLVEESTARTFMGDTRSIPAITGQKGARDMLYCKVVLKDMKKPKEIALGRRLLSTKRVTDKRQTRPC
jgi:hypothetical protein